MSGIGFKEVKKGFKATTFKKCWGTTIVFLQCNLVVRPINGVHSEYISQVRQGASGTESDRSLVEIA